MNWSAMRNQQYVNNDFRNGTVKLFLVKYIAKHYDMPKRLLAQKSQTWLLDFVEVRDEESARNNRKIGSAGLSAGVAARRSFGV